MIFQNIRKLLSELPPAVQTRAAVKPARPPKSRRPCSPVSLSSGKITFRKPKTTSGCRQSGAVHCIGTSRKIRSKKAVEIFDMIETVDSSEMAREIDKRCYAIVKSCLSHRSQTAPANLRNPASCPKMSLLSRIYIRPAQRPLDGPDDDGAGPRRPRGFPPYFIATRAVFNALKTAIYPTLHAVPLHGHDQLLPRRHRGRLEHGPPRHPHFRPTLT